MSVCLDYGYGCGYTDGSVESCVASAFAFAYMISDDGFQTSSESSYQSSSQSSYQSSSRSTYQGYQSSSQGYQSSYSSYFSGYGSSQHYIDGSESEVSKSVLRT